VGGLWSSEMGSGVGRGGGGGGGGGRSKWRGVGREGRMREDDAGGTREGWEGRVRSSGLGGGWV